jgi:membrane associated rhomboid family serine protease
MFRNRGENIRSIYGLLFLNIAFFLLQFQDSAKFVKLFAFDWQRFAAGEIWRAFTYQFMQAGHVGLINIPPVVTLFLNLILLSLMGLSVEEEWGTFHFLTFYLISTLATAGAAAWLGTTLLGSFFINFTLLFVYATVNREQRFWLLIIPIRVTILAWLALAALIAGAFLGGQANVAVLVGAVVGYAYFLSQRVNVVLVKPRGYQPPPDPDSNMNVMTRNLARVSAAKKALGSGAQADIDRLIALSESEIVRGVNICAPLDYKPENADRYCVRCEGFAECTARNLRLNRPAVVPVRTAPVTEP